MTPRRNGKLQTTVAHALERSASDVLSTVPGVWDLALCNGSLFPCTARVDGDWLVFASAAAELQLLPDAWSGLRLNDGHRGPGGVVLDPGGNWMLRADLSLDGPAGTDPEALAARIDTVCVGFARLLDRVAGCDASASPESDDDPDEPDGPDGVDEDADRNPALAELEQHVVSAGWVVQGRASENALVVGLPASTPPLRARLVPGSDGDLALDVPLAARVVTSPTCREALAQHLLAGAGALRLVRAAVGVDDDRVEPRFALRLGPDASPVEIGHGLAALSVACAQYGRECAALAVDALVAERFLVARGGLRRNEAERSSPGPG